METIKEEVDSMNYFDCHCHLLPGLDDGAKDMNESVEMAHILVSLGFSTILCTPHLINGSYDNRPEVIRKTTIALQESLNANNIPLRLHSSIEYYFDEYLLESLDNPLTIEGNIVLLEASRNAQIQSFSEVIYKIITIKKLQPLIAHPERSDLFDLTYENTSSRNSDRFLRFLRKILLVPQYGKEIISAESDRNKDVLTIFKNMGCLFQGSISSFSGIYGKQIRKKAVQLLQSGYYDRLGTDAHAPYGLASWLSEGMHVIRQEVEEQGIAHLLRPVIASVARA